MKKILIISHNDLDGVVCIIIGKKIMYTSKVNFKVCNYNTINENMKKIIESKEYEEYDEIFITDISVNEEIAELIDSISELKAKIKLIDHHASVEWLNKYEWASVIPEKNEQPICASSLFFDYLTNENTAEETKAMYDLAYYTWLWDTWLWKTKYEHLNISEKAVKLNTLFNLLGVYDFINCIVNDKYYEDVEQLLLNYKLLLDIEEKRKNKYIDRKEYQLYSVDIKEYKVGVVFADNYLSELGNTLAERHPEYDFIAIISGSTISFRSCENSKLDLGKISKELYNGGGHKHAAGCPVSKEKLESIIISFLK